MRPQALAVAAAFLLLPLAGCLGGQMATAKDLVPQARKAAEAWSQGAILEGVVGVELREVPAALQAALSKANSGKAASDKDPEMLLMQYRDSDVGDGRTGAWLFAFRGGDRELVLAIDASGKELVRHESSASGRSAPAIGDFKIDSDQATDLAAKANATFRSLRGEAAMGGMTLAATPSGPVWMLMLVKSFDLSLGDSKGPDAGSFAAVMVDANNGTVKSEGDFEDLFGDSSHTSTSSMPQHSSPYYRPRANHTFLATEKGDLQGTMTIMSPNPQEQFKVASTGHASLRLQLALPRGLPPTSASATVTGPDGKTEKLALTASLTGSGPVSAVMDAPAAGEYTVAFHLDAGVMQDYDFSWCAPGSRMTAAGSSDSAACGEA